MMEDVTDFEVICIFCSRMFGSILMDQPYRGHNFLKQLQSQKQFISVQATQLLKSTKAAYHLSSCQHPVKLALIGRMELSNASVLKSILEPLAKNAPKATRDQLMGLASNVIATERQRIVTLRRVYVLDAPEIQWVCFGLHCLFICDCAAMQLAKC